LVELQLVVEEAALQAHFVAGRMLGLDRIGGAQRGVARRDVIGEALVAGGDAGIDRDARREFLLDRRLERGNGIDIPTRAIGAARAACADRGWRDIDRRVGQQVGEIVLHAFVVHAHRATDRGLGRQRVIEPRERRQAAGTLVTLPIGKRQARPAGEAARGGGVGVERADHVGQRICIA
jgi:hypothetical protein